MTRPVEDDALEHQVIVIAIAAAAVVAIAAAAVVRRVTR